MASQFLSSSVNRVFSSLKQAVNEFIDEPAEGSEIFPNRPDVTSRPQKGHECPKDIETPTADSTGVCKNQLSLEEIFDVPDVPSSDSMSSLSLALKQNRAKTDISPAKQQEVVKESKPEPGRVFEKEVIQQSDSAEHVEPDTTVVKTLTADIGDDEAGIASFIHFEIIYI